jgi:uncharacterized protein YndB with AHSA1/START domain
MADKTTHCAEAQMMIRKPAAEVFDAFIDPAKTKNFWFTKGSSRLEKDKEVTWDWEMYNISTVVFPREILLNEKIVYEWGTPPTQVVFNFKELKNGLTYVSVKEYGFSKTGDDLLKVIKDSTGGFTTVLDGLKAYLEYGINLNLIGDKFPKEVTEHGS